MKTTITRSTGCILALAMFIPINFSALALTPDQIRRKRIAQFRS